MSNVKYFVNKNGKYRIVDIDIPCVTPEFQLLKTIRFDSLQEAKDYYENLMFRDGWKEVEEEE